MQGIFGITRRQFVTKTAAGVVASSLIPGSQGSAMADQRDQSSGHRVIIDTDPGVDDAFALLLAMRSPELKIEGLTPVAGNVPLELTLPNALRLVEIAGRTDIPVAAGGKAPLVGRLGSAAGAHGEKRIRGAGGSVP